MMSRRPDDVITDHPSAGGSGSLMVVAAMLPGMAGFGLTDRLIATPATQA